MDLLKISEEIRKAADNVLSRQKMFTSAIANTVIAAISKTVAEKKSVNLNKKDVIGIAEKLTINDNRRSVYTWLHQEFFNRVIVRLRNSKILNCPFIINTASRRKRDIVISLNQNVLDDICELQHIVRYLVNFHDCDGTVINPESDTLCSYVASSMIFANSSFMSSYLTLLAVKKRDVSIDCNYVNLPIKDEPVFYRYFLPFHAAARLNRVVIYYRKHQNKDQEERDDTPLLQMTFPLRSFPTVFKKWLCGVIRKEAPEIAPRLTLRRFTKAAQCLVILESFNQKHADIPLVPSFLYSVHNHFVSSYSYPDFFLSYLINGFDRGSYMPLIEQKQGIYQFKDKLIEAVMSKITAVRRGIYMHKNVTAKKIREEVQRIPSIVKEFESALSNTNYLNVKCYAEWFATRFNTGTNLKTLNDYASAIAAFLDTLASLEKLATEIDDSDLAKAFEILREHYRTRAIKSRVKDFIEFVASEYGTMLSPSIWQKKETKMPEIRTQKPFIGFDLIEKANAHVLRFLASRQVPSGNEMKIKLKMSSPELIHKALQMKHAYCLSFFSGMRRTEVMSRTVRSIRYDDGLLMEIEEGKTDNAKRMIPLFLLMPDSYLAEFTDFVIQRREINDNEALLFAQEDGSPWDVKEFLEDIQDLFISLGIPDYSFHANRGSFASWFLLRWFKVFHHEKVQKDTPFLEYDLFNDKYDERFKQIFWGSQPEQKNNYDFSHALFALARLMGHGGPVITMERYVHTVDWIYYLLMKHYSSNIAITRSQAAHLLQASYSTLLRELERLGKKEITSEDILGLQKKYLMK